MWIRIRCKAADPHPRSKKLAEKSFSKKFTWKNNDRKILDFLFASTDAGWGLEIIIESMSNQ